MNPSISSRLFRNRRVVLCLFLSYVLLLIMSYGFPVTGDDWYFSLKYNTSCSIWESFVRGCQISAHHYQTTNGRLLGNFLVTFLSCSKVLREVIRCGIILSVVVYVFRLSLNRGITSYLVCFALLISLPPRVVSQTYTWSAGFCNYVPPALFFLIYISCAQSVFCGGERRKSLARTVGIFFLGFCAQLFLENFSLGMCALSLFVFIFDWVKNKKMDAAFGAHLIGAVLGVIWMFLAPGYRNVGVEGYREIATTFSAILEVLKKNFKNLSYFLLLNNFQVVIPLCLCGAFVCLRKLREDPDTNRIPVKGCIFYFFAFPLICAVLRFMPSYRFFVLFLSNSLFFLALFLTAIFCVKESGARYVILVSSGSFLVFLAPLLLVTPVGARNAYFFDVLLILICMTLFRQFVQERTDLKRYAPLLVLAACALLCLNLVIHLRNGQMEQLRNRIAAETFEKGEHEMTLPGYPYPFYIHYPGQVDAISTFYYYDHPGDIQFHFVPYAEWKAEHPNDP